MANPLSEGDQLHAAAADEDTQVANPQAEILPGDSATTKAEKIQRHGTAAANGETNSDNDERSSKRRKLGQDPSLSAAEPTTERRKGVAPIKKEYLVEISKSVEEPSFDDDAAESSGKANGPETVGGRGPRDAKQKGKRGQNHARQFGSSRDEIALCKSRAGVNEFHPQDCSYGAKCKFEHDIRKYLKDGKREDLQTLGGVCPLFEAKGNCPAGWRCRFAGSHSKEVEREDARKELVLVEKDQAKKDPTENADEEDEGVGVVNVVHYTQKIKLRKKQWKTDKADKYLDWMNKENLDPSNGNPHSGADSDVPEVDGDGIPIDKSRFNGAVRLDNRARYVEPPFRASEKRRLYYGPETPVLAPLTTQGNLPFRRLAVSLGAQVTWSEMAMGLPLIQGEKGEWALMKAHESEATPPAYSPKTPVLDYNHSRDLKFGAQIAANKPWLALKTTEVLTSLCPSLRAIDLNCGCPIDLVCRQGAGSAMLDAHTKLEKTLRGMNVVSGEVPITVKIRMGTKDKSPTAEKLCQRLVMGSPDSQESGEGPCGVAAITLHGRSKQQRYTRSADWEYISSCAALVKKLKTQRASMTDTIREPDARDSGTGSDALPYFCGNGDILSHIDYNEHIANAGVDSCMIARGALIKPWIFEEIETNQYLDKSATERLGYIEQFCRNGLEYWGSDEIGVGTTRRFLLEWMSFACRYVPVGILEYLPPRFGDRPPAFRGRNELETLLSSANYKDWIKISEMFLGPAHKDFQFMPKHKSNSYEIEAEG
ncbi:tRNA-dihydrouridine synthase 3 [Recurvomyces mirabilis]|uniref:tRNA-dihydrouridine(47) synthase [NAD(P)(+)] n=1 Tax=Recurvomyces mirabilis TaxID=574656 RepID=A0AAE0WGM1_9PEZI|nr:tRNA-dihydrouridine synthase 3 [Recurvomyces mirabilis]KAK5155000.1 tRNA-dihydrouridine synthase 3 [Recurvomyces mirabilis]